MYLIKTAFLNNKGDLICPSMTSEFILYLKLTPLLIFIKMNVLERKSCTHIVLNKNNFDVNSPTNRYFLYDSVSECSFLV